MKKIILATMIVCVGLFVTGCSKKPDPLPDNPPPVDNLKVGAAPTHKDVAINGNFFVTFNENPPNKWFVQSKPDFLKLTDENKKTYPNVQVRRFVFLATAAGEGDLVMVHRDGAYLNSTVLETVTYHIVAK